MRKAEQHALMVEWFGQNYEDPAERTSYVSAEGGYLWNWGGPYDAREELYDKFGDIVSEALIEEVAKEVEADGLTEWAPTPRREDYDDEPPLELFSFGNFSDLPTEQYGSQQDLQARERVRAALKDLLAALDEKKPAGIGHNNPPEAIIDADALGGLRSDALALQAEFSTLRPSIQIVKKLGSSLRDAAVASFKWIGRKADLAVDTAIKTAVPLAATAAVASYNEALRKAIDAIIAWLNVVAHKITF